MTTAYQQNLFSWDTTILGEGYDALSELNFSKATSTFKKILTRQENHSTALRSLQLTKDWQDLIKKSRKMEILVGAEFLFSSIQRYPFKDQAVDKILKVRLLAEVAQRVEQKDSTFLSSSGFCLGQVYIESKQFQKGIECFAPHLKNDPHNIKLLVSYGNALLKCFQEHQASICLIKALLIAPKDVMLLKLECQPLNQFIDEFGFFMAPIYYWIERGMPPIDVPPIEPNDFEHTAALFLFNNLKHAEKIRMQKDYQSMVKIRELIRKQDSGVFEYYMGRGRK